ncbi:MAG: Transcriptional regulator, MarR family with acetyltransferase [Mucilaginibacter sp.]|nr:Transcriptional regulator, MarR family with acetyltransferase [Mucilaginibacter sp.]
MNIIDELEELAVGARLKRLYEYFAKDVAMIYKDEQLNFEPKYFTLYYLISKQGEAGVTEIAEELGLTHPGVIHLAKELEELGFIESAKSTTDSRRRLLRLSAKGRESLPKLERVWAKIVALNKALFNNQQNNLLSAIMETEAQLNEKSYYQRFQEMFNPQGNSPVKVITYEPQYARHFKNLNIEWINTYFTVEEHDLEQLDHPEEHILADGGEILFAQINDDIAGTCALIKTSPTDYELAKMAVSPKYQGRKIGNFLMNAAIAKVKELGGTRIWLGSNRDLVPAISLYKKYGFTEFKAAATPYQRANIHMELSL